MKTETRAWAQLQRHASAQLRPGFADRVVRAARAGAEAVPSLLSIFTLSAATAALCLLAVTLLNTRPLPERLPPRRHLARPSTAPNSPPKSSACVPKLTATANASRPSTWNSTANSSLTSRLSRPSRTPPLKSAAPIAAPRAPRKRPLNMIRSPTTRSNNSANALFLACSG